MAKKTLIYSCASCGSAIAEAFFELGKIDFDRKEVDYSKVSPEQQEMTSHNPLGQVPTLILPSGEVLTETLAVAHYVHSLVPEAGLIPTENLAKFLRWSTFLVTAIYPTFTYGDDPSKWIKLEVGAKELRESTNEHRKKLWLTVEEHAGQPYFLGEQFSAIDIYIGIMNRWRPGTDWFKENCPKLSSISIKVAEMPALHKTWTLNFG